MNVIPHIDNPKIEDILKYIDKIPCHEKVEAILLDEVSKGNVILHAGDAGFMIDETVVFFIFKEDAKNDYPESKITGSYRALYFSDNNGAVEIRFRGVNV